MVEGASAKFVVVVDETKVGIVTRLPFSLQELRSVVDLKFCMSLRINFF